MHGFTVTQGYNSRRCYSTQGYTVLKHPIQRLSIRQIPEQLRLSGKTKPVVIPIAWMQRAFRI